MQILRSAQLVIRSRQICERERELKSCSKEQEQRGPEAMTQEETVSIGETPFGAMIPEGIGIEKTANSAKRDRFGPSRWSEGTRCRDGVEGESRRAMIDTILRAGGTGMLDRITLHLLRRIPVRVVLTRANGVIPEFGVHPTGVILDLTETGLQQAPLPGAQEPRAAVKHGNLMPGNAGGIAELLQPSPGAAGGHPRIGLLTLPRGRMRWSSLASE